MKPGRIARIPAASRDVVAATPGRIASENPSRIAGCSCALASRVAALRREHGKSMARSWQ